MGDYYNLMYAKLFASLYQGTLRGCADELLVFTNLLAHADSLGVVDKHWRAIAEETGISRERVEAAIANLEAPDPDSRSPEEGGRRLVRMDDHRAWGWRIVNYVKYRTIRSEEDRREQNRLAQERWRNRHKPPSAEAKQEKPRKPQSAQAEAEAEAEEDSVPNGTVGKPTDPVKEIFDEGIALLANSGIPDRQARSLIGKWRSQATDTRVGELIREAREHNISHPVEWMAKAVMGNGGQREDYNTRRIRLAREAIR